MEEREEGSAIVPVEGSFLSPASVKAQKIAKGKKQKWKQQHSRISKSIKKAVHETWKRLKG